MRDILKQVPLLADMSESDLEELSATAECVYLASGEVLFEEGSIGDKAYVIEAGELEIIKQSSGREVMLAVRKPGEVIGEMSILEDTPRMASVRARGRATVLAIEKDALDALLETSASAARAMLFNVLARWRATGTMLKQSERMAQLGTLTAGVAHELNNPAAAVKRGSSHLQDAITEFAAAQRRLGEQGGDAPKLAALEQEIRDNPMGGTPEDALDRADRESDLEGWLDDKGIDEPWELAPVLAELKLDRDALDALAAGGDATRAEALIRSLVATQSVHSLLAEVSEGAGRISEIVKSLKTYSYLDQAPVQSVDLHEGLDSTLVILRSKYKQGITVHREYAPDLPKIHAYGSELNQVWTNLLDNAADALEGSGNVTLRTRRAGDTVEVEIEDDGPGIPEDIQGKIFDAFFTTKPPGKGTGLGLDISYNTIVNRHRGDIKLVSRPGMTCFRVILPINFEDSRSSMSGIEEVSEDDLQEILLTSRTVAVVGIKDRPGVPAHDIPADAQARGYTIWPVNPKFPSVLGVESHADLSSLPGSPDVVLIFRRSEHVPPIVDAAIAAGAKVVWMQPGIVNEAAADVAHKAGLKVVMDTCWGVTMRRLAPDGPTEA